MSNGEGRAKKRSEDSVHFGVVTTDRWNPLWDHRVREVFNRELRSRTTPLTRQDDIVQKEEVVKEDSPLTEPPKERFQVPVVVLVELIAQAIANFEGFYLQKSDPSVAQRFNNPGNLRSWGNIPEEHADGAAGTFVHFPTAQEGWRALRIQVWVNVISRENSLVDLSEFFQRYNDSSDDNRPVKYAEFIQKYLEDRGVHIPISRAVMDMGILYEGKGAYPGLQDV